MDKFDAIRHIILRGSDSSVVAIFGLPIALPTLTDNSNRNGQANIIDGVNSSMCIYVTGT